MYNTFTTGPGLYGCSELASSLFIFMFLHDDGPRWYLERSLLPGVALATMLVKPILYFVGSIVSAVWLSSSSVNPDRNKHFPARIHTPHHHSLP